MMRPPGEMVETGSTDSSEMADLQSLLDRIHIQGISGDADAVNEVAENLRLRLNLSSE